MEKCAYSGGRLFSLRSNLAPTPNMRFFPPALIKCENKINLSIVIVNYGGSLTHKYNRHRMNTQAGCISTLTTAMAPPPTTQALEYVAARTIQAAARRWLFRHEVYVQRELRRWAPFKRCWERTHAHPLAGATYNKASINALLSLCQRTKGEECGYSAIDLLTLNAYKTNIL